MRTPDEIMELMVEFLRKNAVSFEDMEDLSALIPHESEYDPEEDKETKEAPYVPISEHELEDVVNVITQSVKKPPEHRGPPKLDTFEVLEDSYENEFEGPEGGSLSVRDTKES